MFSIKISDDVHTNVRSNTYYEQRSNCIEGVDGLKKVGNSLWSGFTSLLGEEYALNMHFTFDGKEYVAKVGYQIDI